MKRLGLAGVVALLWLFVVGPTFAGWVYHVAHAVEECELRYESWEAHHPGRTLVVVLDGSSCGRIEEAGE